MKRLRASNNRSNIGTCLVDGCNSDLRNCRDYYKRHKVCETHSKTLQVSVCGLKQRFCQQCSRFHSLEQFDEVKRSCRKSLDGHNRRRRKPQLDPSCRSGSFFSNFQGSQLFNLSGSHMYPSATIPNPSWSAILTSQTNARLYNLQQQLHFPDKQNLFFNSSLVSSYKKEKPFPFLQNDHPSTNDQTSATSAICQPLLRTFSLNDSNEGSHSMFCNRLTAEETDSDCALSLLSTKMQTQNSENHMLMVNSVPLLQPMDLGFHDHSLGAMDPGLDLGGTGSITPCSGLFQLQSRGFSGFRSPRTSNTSI